MAMQLGSDIVVPGAAMIVMAMEAMSQRAQALHHLEGKNLPSRPCYKVRNATFTKALVLEEGQSQAITIELNVRTGSRDSWCDFKIQSRVNEGWTEHSRGLVRAEDERPISMFNEVRTGDNLAMLTLSSGFKAGYATTETQHAWQALVPGKSFAFYIWINTYGPLEAMEDVGYALGPSFQKHLEAESLSGSRESRSLVSLAEPASTYAQSKYQMHPTSVDGILQVCAPALWNGNRTNINAVIIPAIIDEVVICAQPTTTTIGMACVTSSYAGVGDPNETKNYTADVDVYDVNDGRLLLRLSKLRTSILNTQAVSHVNPVYCCLKWKPDITLVTPSALARHLEDIATSQLHARASIDEVINLVAFKTPNMRVAESVMIVEDSASIWLDGLSAVRTACESFQYMHADPKALLAAQEAYSLQKVISFDVNNFTKPKTESVSADATVDFLVLRTVSLRENENKSSN